MSDVHGTESCSFLDQSQGLDGRGAVGADSYDPPQIILVRIGVITPSREA